MRAQAPLLAFAVGCTGPAAPGGSASPADSAAPPDTADSPAPDTGPGPPLGGHALALTVRAWPSGGAPPAGLCVGAIDGDALLRDPAAAPAWPTVPLGPDGTATLADEPAPGPAGRWVQVAPCDGMPGAAWPTLTPVRAVALAGAGPGDTVPVTADAVDAAHALALDAALAADGNRVPLEAAGGLLGHLRHPDGAPVDRGWLRGVEGTAPWHALPGGGWDAFGTSSAAAGAAYAIPGPPPGNIICRVEDAECPPFVGGVPAAWVLRWDFVATASSTR